MEWSSKIKDMTAEYNKAIKSHEYNIEQKKTHHNELHDFIFNKTQKLTYCERKHTHTH